VLPLDVNESEEDYVVEPVDQAVSGIRLALKDVHGISSDERRSILEARADRRFDTVEDFNRRTRVSQPVLEAIAHAGGFDRLRREPRRGSRRDRLFEAMAAEPSREGDQLALAVHEPVETSLRDYNDAERVRAELEVLGVDGSRHLMTFFEGLMEDLHVIRSKDLWRERSDTWVMVAGVKVASQTPAVRSGQRIIFLTLDDATGPVDVTVFERAQARCAKTVFHSFVLAVWGRLRRTGVRGVSIVAEEVWDVAALDRARRRGELDRALFAPPGPGLPPRKLWHASGGSAGW
jgi:error-prone DNA polymerase